MDGYDTVGILENLRASHVIRVQKDILDERFLLARRASAFHENIQALPWHQQLLIQFPDVVCEFFIPFLTASWGMCPKIERLRRRRSRITGGKAI